MNEFLAQFLIEARELLAEATGDLSRLKAVPGDRQGLDRVFRAFHTLKGAAGIVEFDAMGRLMHHIEDALAQARSDGQAVSSALIERSVTGLDLLETWLDQISGTGALPVQASEDVDRLLMEKQDRSLVKAEEEAESLPDSTAWIAEIFGDKVARLDAMVAIRYLPGATCFFDKVDPLAQISGLPGLCALSVRPVEAWPDIDELDPFHSNLVIHALSRAPIDRVKAYVEKTSSAIETFALNDAPLASQSVPAGAAALLIATQIDLLSSSAAEGMAGRIGSAGRVVGNIERYLGNVERAAVIDRLTADAIETGETAFLIRELRTGLREDAPVAASVAEKQPDAQPGLEVATSLRVDVRRIDAALKLIGELGVAKNALEHLSRLASNGAPSDSLAKPLKDLHAQLQTLTDELRQSVLAMRVLPLRQVFQRFPRLLREISSRLGREVELVTEGDATEADKVVVESLFDPLLHVLRNAIDHGIESPEERVALGKGNIATIRLRGYREGGHVVIEVIDDGRGIDAETIRKVAEQRGLFSADALKAMTAEDVLQLIFMPGFSTAKSVTDLSGRGVGMDAVRAAIDRLGGTVNIQTQPKRGTTIRLTLPFSVMMTRILTVEANGQVFGLPFEAVVEMLHVPLSSIVAIGATQAIVWRDQTIPLINLPMALGRERGQGPGRETHHDSKAQSKVVITGTGSQVGAIEVDRFGEPMDLMLSPPEGLLAGLTGITGTTLLGDGRVLVVLDLEALLQ